MTDKITLSISEELEKKLKEKIKQTNFESLKEYILFILEQIVSDEGVDKEKIVYTKKEEEEIRGHQEWTAEGEGKSAYSEEEESDLKKNLEDLGYV